MGCLALGVTAVTSARMDVDLSFSRLAGLAVRARLPERLGPDKVSYAAGAQESATVPLTHRRQRVLRSDRAGC